MGVANMQFREGPILKLGKNRVHLVLSEEELAGLDIQPGRDDDPIVIVDPLPAGAKLPAALADTASAIVLEVRPGEAASIERIADLRATRPNLPLIAAIRDADLALVKALIKQGVNDVVALPLAYGELMEALRDLPRVETAAHSGTSLGRLTTVIRSIGGVGATTIATQLACQLSDHSTESGGRGVCLFDLDLQFGNVATYLGATPDRTVSDLLKAGQRVDGDLIRSMATSIQPGLDVIAPPAELMPLESIDSDQLLDLVSMARGSFDDVMLDLPANWTSWTLSLAARSTDIIFVVELTVASLKQGRRQLQLLKSSGVEDSAITVVANRVSKKLFRSIGLSDAAQALGHPIGFTVSNDYPLVSAAHDQGVLIQEIRRKSKLAADIAKIGEHLCAVWVED